MIPAGILTKSGAELYYINFNGSRAEYLYPSTPTYTEEIEYRYNTNNLYAAVGDQPIILVGGIELQGYTGAGLVRVIPRGITPGELHDRRDGRLLAAGNAHVFRWGSESGGNPDVSFRFHFSLRDYMAIPSGPPDNYLWSELRTDIFSIGSETVRFYWDDAQGTPSKDLESDTWKSTSVLRTYGSHVQLWMTYPYPAWEGESFLSMLAIEIIERH